MKRGSVILVTRAVLLILGLVAVHPAGAAAQEQSADLAKKLANPLASLISIPVDVDFDSGIGSPDDGHRVAFILKPVVPVRLNEDWNLISRTILPVVTQSDIFPGAGGQFGLGDILQSFFFSPARATSWGLVWGVGPALLLPTATDALLGGEKLAIGPTAVVLKQNGPWTFGMLANHLWDVTGDDERAGVNNTFVQPFMSYTTPTGWTYSVATETTYAWDAETWTVPISAGVSKLTRLGGLPVQYKAGLRYWADSPVAAAKGWGFKLGFVILLPK